MTERKIPVNALERNSPSKDSESPEFRVVDRRHFTDLDKIPEAPPEGQQPRYPTFVEELMARLSETENRFEEKRKQVDEEIARTRSRLQGEYERKLQSERGNLLLPLLEVLDNLERAVDAAEKGGSLESLLRGVTLTANLFRSKLQGSGVEAIPVLHQPFDPNLGQAIGVVEVADAAQDGLVVEEVQRGYKIGDQLVRPAQVRVGKLVATTN